MTYFIRGLKLEKLLFIPAILFFFLLSFFMFRANVYATCKDNPSECVFDNSECPDDTWWNRSDCIYIQKIGSGGCDTGQDCEKAGGRVYNSKRWCIWQDRPSQESECGATASLACSCGKIGCPPGTLPDPLDPNCEGGKGTIGYLIGRVLPFIPILLGLILLTMIIIGGIKIATAGDNDEAKKKGFSTITNALIGAGILLFAIVIIALLEAIFKVKILYGFGG